LFLSENKQITSLLFLIGNNIETSEFLFSSSFCTKY